MKRHSGSRLGNATVKFLDGQPRPSAKGNNRPEAAGHRERSERPLDADTGRPSLAIWTTAKDAMPSLTGDATIRERFQKADVARRSPADGFTLWRSRNSRWGNRPFPSGSGSFQTSSRTDRCPPIRRISYRFRSVNHNHDGFVYDTPRSGIELKVGTAFRPQRHPYSCRKLADREHTMEFAR